MQRKKKCVVFNNSSLLTNIDVAYYFEIGRLLVAKKI